MVNDPFMPLDHAQYLFIHDSVHGKFQGMCEVAGDALVVNGSRVRFTGMHACADIPWASEGVETVAECTGAFTTTAKCAGHLAGGARAVVISAPAHDEGTPTYVVGVNHEQYRAGEAVVSMASCTTNCLAPLVKVVLEQWGLAEGLMTTVHAVTATQKTVDGPCSGGKDWRGGRSAFGNIIPASTGAAKALGLVLPSASGKLTGMAFRVPTLDVSCVDLTVRLERPATMPQIAAAFKAAAEGGPLKGILGWTDEAVVSSDFVHDARSAVFDSSASIAISPCFVKLVAW
jgi:glyceraldehyde 3-phosphate dehydrogenase